MSFTEKVSSKRGSIPPKELEKLLKLAYELKLAMQSGDVEKLKVLEQSRGMLISLLEFLILNLGGQDVDVEMINLIAKFLGIDLHKEREDELEEEKEEELTKAEKERRHRLMIYEIYKMLNPNRLAGETSLENFINNVKTRGINTALRYEGAEHVKGFKAKELDNLESHNHGFRAALVKAGFKGGGIER